MPISFPQTPSASWFYELHQQLSACSSYLAHTYVLYSAPPNPSGSDRTHCGGSKFSPPRGCETSVRCAAKWQTLRQLQPYSILSNKSHYLLHLHGQTLFPFKFRSSQGLKSPDMGQILLAVHIKTPRLFVTSYKFQDPPRSLGKDLKKTKTEGELESSFLW